MNRVYFILIIIFLLESYSYSQSNYPKIDFTSSLEMGYEDRVIITSFANESQTCWWLNSKEFCDIVVGAKMGKFYLHSNVKTYFAPEKIYRYKPMQSEYKIGLDFSFKRFTFSAEHMCSHSIESKALKEFYDRFSVKIRIF